MGTNEIGRPGDGGMRDAGDNNAGRLRDETTGARESSGAGSLDTARANCEAKCGPMNTWMSMSEKPEEFQKQTGDLAKQTPEQIREAMANNEAQIKAVQPYIDGLKARIEAVKKAQASQEKLELQQRSGM